MSKKDRNENLTTITINVQHLASSDFDLEELMNALLAQVEDAPGVKAFWNNTETELDIWGVTQA